MIIFLYGSDTYRSRQKLNEIIERYKKIHKSGLNLKYFDSKDLNFQDFKSEFQQAPMFKEKKLAVLNDALSNAEFEENFLKNEKNFRDSGNIILFYEKGEVNTKNPLFKFLIKYAQSQEFEPLLDQQLKNWAKKEFGKHKCQIREQALEKLIEFVGNDLWRLTNEIKKLANFKLEIKNKDIELLVRPKIETDIFKTIDSLAAKNKKLALELIRQHLEKGDPPLYLLSMITLQFCNLLTIKDLLENSFGYYDILRKSNLHPYVVKKSFEQAKKFTLPELKKIYQKIFQVDLDIKTGKIEPETALDLLIAEI